MLERIIKKQNFKLLLAFAVVISIVSGAVLVWFGIQTGVNLGNATRVSIEDEQKLSTITEYIQSKYTIEHIEQTSLSPKQTYIYVSSKGDASDIAKVKSEIDAKFATETVEGEAANPSGYTVESVDVNFDLNIWALILISVIAISLFSFVYYAELGSKLGTYRGFMIYIANLDVFGFVVLNMLAIVAVGTNMGWQLSNLSLYVFLMLAFFVIVAQYILQKSIVEKINTGSDLYPAMRKSVLDIFVLVCKILGIVTLVVLPFGFMYNYRIEVGVFVLSLWMIWISFVILYPVEMMIIDWITDRFKLKQK